MRKIKIMCTNTGTVFNSLTEASLALNVKQTFITRILSDKYCHKTIKGYGFVKVEESTGETTGETAGETYEN